MLDNLKTRIQDLNNVSPESEGHGPIARSWRLSNGRPLAAGASPH